MTSMSEYTWTAAALAVGYGLFVVSCGASGSSSVDAGGDGALGEAGRGDAAGSGGAGGARDSGLMAGEDGAFETGIVDRDGEPTEGGASDAAVVDAGPIVTCFELLMGGSSIACGYESSTMPGFTCASPLSPGTCPSKGLEGCCIDTLVYPTFTEVAAACYYDADAARTAKAACKPPAEVWSSKGP
jgi:hypothetical protein